MPEIRSDAASGSGATAGADRLAWLDYAKAFAIALVVFGHASRSAERTDGLGWGDGLRLADQLIYSFHIPLFFVLAGYAAHIAAGRGWAGQMRGLWWGVAVPYVIWSVVWVALKVAYPGAVNEPADWGRLATAIWDPVEHLWFLQHLFLARLFWMAAERAGASGAGAGGLLVFVLFVIASWTATVESQPRVLAALLGNVAFTGAGFILLPLLLRHARDGVFAVFAAVSLSAWFALAMQLGADDLGATSFAAALFAVIVVLAAVWRLAPPDSVGARAVAFLGEASLAIYVLHGIVIAAVRAVLQMAGLLDASSLIVAGTVLGLAIPAAGFWIALGLSARSGWPVTRYAGLGAATRSYYWPTAGAAVAIARPPVAVQP